MKYHSWLYWLIDNIISTSTGQGSNLILIYRSLERKQKKTKGKKTKEDKRKENKRIQKERKQKENKTEGKKTKEN